MKRFQGTRPSPAMVLAAFALVFAMVGTAVAGPDAISDKLNQTKVRSIAKKQAKKQAKKAIDKRASGLSVASAQTAVSADSVKTLVPFGPVTVAEGAADQALASHGPLSLVGSCDAEAAATESNVQVASTEANTAFGGDDTQETDLGPGTAEVDRRIEDPGATSTTTAVHSDGYDDQFSMVAPSGAAMHGTVSSIANGAANTCTYYGSVEIIR